MSPSSDGGRKRWVGAAARGFGAFVTTRLQVIASVDEIWVAIATHDVDGRFVDERLRDVLSWPVSDAAEAELMERRAVWTLGGWAWFEAARLGLREPTDPTRARPAARCPPR